MKDRTATIRNIYVMLAYAFRAIRTPDASDVGTEEFTHIHDLFAEILAQGVSAQVKRGVHHDYLRRDEQLTTVRGRIDVTATMVAHRAVTPGSVSCTFDAYEPDTPFNQALKSVMVLLIRHGEVGQPRKDALRRLLPYLDAVTLASPRSIRWEKFTYHRRNAAYRILLGVCQLVVEGLLPTENSGDTQLAEWLSQEAMSALYERFLREYYAFHHPELSPAARHVAWDYDPVTAVGADQLPAMRTDVTLTSGTRTLIIDAKYYSQPLTSGAYGKLTVHSANLYQMLSYIKNADVSNDGTVSGLLLYARTDAPAQPNVDVVIQGNRLGARTLDLAAPWPDLRHELEAQLAWL